MYTIIGSGFGLYGYLPALIECLGKSVVLPMKYQANLKSRAELQPFYPKVEWVTDINAALQHAHSAVIAAVPFRQKELVEHCLQFPNIRRLILEKPISSNPLSAIKLINELNERKIQYAVAYTLANLDWNESLSWPIGENSVVTIKWDFMAHHFSKSLFNWKRSHEKGGGAIRFYGIHLLAMLALRGYSDASTLLMCGETADDIDTWRASFHGVGLPKCYVDINCRADKSRFIVSFNECKPALSLSDPFALETSINNLDRRVSVLSKIIMMLDERETTSDDRKFYERVNSLWFQAESNHNGT